MKLYDESSSCIALCLSVIKAEGVVPEIFVHSYSPTTSSYKFQHTAYYDELDTISDVVENNKAACYVRKASVEHRACDLETANAFVDDICNDVKRLLTQCKFFSDDLDDTVVDVVVITPNSIETTSNKEIDDSITIGGIEVEI